MRAMPTAIIALLLSREQAAPLAYIGGLIGADLLNLGSARGLGAPVASIHTASFHRAVCELVWGDWCQGSSSLPSLCST